jgi:lysophospholipase L1-like esterase
MLLRIRVRNLLPLLAVTGWLLAAGLVQAQEKKNTAVIPSMKGEDRHKGFLAIAKSGNIDVVFFGDSITDGWRNKNGIAVWKERFEPLKAANFGIGGDRTQHVLWRMQNGELEGYKPKAMVLMIGTNNLRDNSAAEIADGIKAIVAEVQKKQPQTKILLLGIFPRSPKPDDVIPFGKDKVKVKVRDKIKDINQIIAKLEDGKRVKYLDIGDKFLQKDGELTKEIMPDYLHLSAKGYQIWADAIQKPLAELLK